jgi:Uma2 family endonuclease
MNELVTADQLSSVLEEQIAQIAPEWFAEHPDLRERLAEVLAGDPDQLLLPAMSYDEFLAWAKNGVHAEWVEGRIVLMSPPSSRHQKLVVFLVTLLNMHVSARNLGTLFTAPFQMRLHQPPRGREPDILFVAQAKEGQITNQYLDGPADLVVEIISPECAARDRGDKYYEYEAAGVGEYWLIDPQREQAEFYELDDRGRYTLALGGHMGAYSSRVIPGLTLHVAWLWQEPLPPVWETKQS